ncbi:hypothetical protein K3552_02215 [Leisingera aquaemixtae]|uniref:hypothetical protein n=1 Tax=Leisingera aquaemixtae TaxID=1396826 RepID=UPI0021A8E24C|nr:hypothetical protein [Leisingera aquaemixtae]UWQ37845.1 hypothetical protein K3552_02215 [Leisingera aquaemixtae]
MTLASAGSGVAPRRDLPQLPVTVAAVFAMLLLTALFQLPDPMIRHDDYPALLADPSLFYSKTLTEGRWVNYLWHLRGFVTPAWLNFLAYQFLWAVYLGCLVHNAFGREAETWQRVMVALIAGLGLPWVLISLWFNTLIPGLAIVALYAWLATRLSERACRWLMLVFVPVSLMAYTTYPFLILGLSLTRAGVARSARDLAGLLALFIASFALGMLAIYSLNYAVHGVFGVPMAEWRNPSPARDLASALENSKLAWQFLVSLAQKGAYNNTVLALLQWGLLACAVWAVLRQDKWRAIYLVSGAFLGLALICLQVIRSGIDMPVRSGGFLWIFGAMFIGLFVLTLRDSGRPRLSRNLLFAVTAVHVIFGGLTYRVLTEWHRVSRAMAAELAEGQGPVYVTGTYLSLEAARKSDLQKHHSVAFRLHHLTGREIVMCESRPEDCAQLPEELRAGLQGRTGFEVRQIDGGSVLMLSPEALRQDKLEAARQLRQAD